MAEWVCRTLRDGGSEGEHAPALTINDTISSPLGSFFFDHVLSQLSSFVNSKKSQSKSVQKNKYILQLCLITVSLSLSFFLYSDYLIAFSSFNSGIVLVALARSPLYYEQLLKGRGFDVVSSSTWFGILNSFAFAKNFRSSFFLFWLYFPGSWICKIRLGLRFWIATRIHWVGKASSWRVGPSKISLLDLQ